MSDDEKKAATSVRGGWPAEQNNGLFGGEERIMALGVGGRLTAVCTIEVDDILHSEADGTRRPVVKFVQIEPVWDAEDREAADDLRETARAIRAGETQLDFGNMGAAADEANADDSEDGVRTDDEKPADEQ